MRRCQCSTSGPFTLHRGEPGPRPGGRGCFWPSSVLRYPTTDETATPDGIGRFNHFSSTVNSTRVDGSIYWTPGTGAWSIHGAIVTKWEAMGAERSCLGYPLSDEFSITGGRRNNLQHGIIRYSFSTRQAVSSC